MSHFLQQHHREAVNVLMTLAALAAVICVSLVAGAVAQRTSRSICDRLERALDHLASPAWRAVTIVTLVSLIASVLTTAVAGPALPSVHDEFSYLLAADTFAHGRLSNPPLPAELRPFFDTMHVLQTPHYASKFGPAQGATLAIGEALFHRPDVGAWLSTAAACAAVAWALRGWMPARWAMLGGLIVAVHPEVMIWGHSYWGGSVGMFGGALVTGALVRLFDRHRAAVGAAIVSPARFGDGSSVTGDTSVAPTREQHVVRNAALLTAGLGVLANSRPYEAAVWAVAAAVTLLVAIARTPASIRVARVARLSLGAGLVAAPVIAFMLYYNLRVTGDPLTLPYTLHVRQYMQVPLFFWSRPPPQKTGYTSQSLRDQYDGYERNYFERQRTLRGWCAFAATKVYKFVEHFLLRSLPMLVGLGGIVCAVRAARDSRTRLALLYAMWFVLAWAVIPWFEWHYVGPLLAVLAVLMMQGLRGLRACDWRGMRRRRVGQVLVWLCVLSSLVVVAPTIAREHRLGRNGWWVERAAIQRQLESRGGKHLVIVRYAPGRDPAQEWVYNGADLAGSRVIWARDFDDPAMMRRLLDAFPDRKAWLVNADSEPRTLVPYPLR